MKLLYINLDSSFQKNLKNNEEKHLLKDKAQRHEDPVNHKREPINALGEQAIRRKKWSFSVLGVFFCILSLVRF